MWPVELGFRVARDGGVNRVGSTARGDTIENGLHMALAKEYARLDHGYVSVHYHCALYNTFETQRPRANRKRFTRSPLKFLLITKKQMEPSAG